MTDYPNREHKNADEAARRRALSALDAIRTHADQLIRRLEAGHDVDGSDAARFGGSLADLTVNLSALETLREVREWHAADRAQGAWHDDWEVIERDSDGNAILRHRPTDGLYRILPLGED